MSETRRPTTDEEIEARVAEREDLVERVAQGDTSALGELVEHATGAKIRSIKVTGPHSTAPAAGG